MRIPDRGSTTGEASWTDRTRSGRAAHRASAASQSPPAPYFCTVLAFPLTLALSPGGRGESSRHGLPLSLFLSPQERGKFAPRFTPHPFPLPAGRGEVRATFCPSPLSSPRRERGKFVPRFALHPTLSPNKRGKSRATVYLKKQSPVARALKDHYSQSYALSVR